MSILDCEQFSVTVPVNLLLVSVGKLKQSGSEAELVGGGPEILLVQ